VFGAQTGAGNPTARGGVLPPRVTLETSGRRPWSFHRTGEEARLEARFLPRLLVGGVAGLLGVLALAAAWVLARKGVSPFAAAFAYAAVALLAYPSAAPGLRPALATLGAAAAVVAFVGAVAMAVRGRHGGWKRYPDGSAGPSSSPPPAPAPAPAPPPASPAAGDPQKDEPQGGQP
jgi:hypothetical protein